MERIRIIFMSSHDSLHNGYHRGRHPMEWDNVTTHHIFHALKECMNRYVLADQTEV